MTISVIMSTYHREQPQYLDAAMNSIWMNQKRRPEEIVLVEDGHLTPELYGVVDKWKRIIGDALIIIAKEKNSGLAAALNDAISVAKGDLIARMDSDDISLSERFSLQEKYMDEHPEVDILGGGLCEFNDEGTLYNVRYYPQTMDNVKNTIHRMCPLAHPSVMFRKRFFDNGHRYSSKYHICEDVELWFEAVHDGCIINNIPDVIINFRLNDSMMTRRSREKAWAEFFAYNNGIYKLYGYFTTRYIFSLYRLVFRLMPTFIIQRVYKCGKFRNINAGFK